MLNFLYHPDIVAGMILVFLGGTGLFLLYVYISTTRRRQIPFQPRNNNVLEDDVDETINELIPPKQLLPESSASATELQRFLDDYIEREKDTREIGEYYERQIGIYYEQNGYRVDYVGITENINDKGRDLICRKDGKIYVVQCKCWSKQREVHENSICQLFGTTVEMYLQENPRKTLADYEKQTKYIPVIMVTTSYSETATEFANRLGVKLENQDLARFPMIKCKADMRKYFLPWDKDYDRIHINQKSGDLFLDSVLNAEKLGFAHCGQNKVAVEI